MTLGAIIAVSSALIWPFPDRMSAYVWRNWTIVPKERLAAAVGTTPGDLTKIAAEMGLPDQGRIAPEWDTLGRKSIIRRNWNIVPRSQWLLLAPPDPKSDSNSGEADEYLKWHFGGGTFPEIPELRFNADEAAKSAASRRAIAWRLGREGVEMSDDAWRPFAFKRELDELSGVKSHVKEAFRRVSPDALAVCWDWGWNEDEAMRAIPRLHPVDTGNLATMTGIPYDNLARWVGNIPTNAWISAMEKVAAGFDGLAALHFRSAADQARFVVARNAGDVGQMRYFAAREIKTAKAAMKELCRDSRNAYELSNGYYYNLQDLREKILGCSMIVDPPSVFPEKTLSFPGSGCTSFAVDGRVLVAVSAWTREKGAVVFDVSDPANMRFAADLPARGYSTSDPILVGERVYQPLWYGVARVNLADPARPVLEELMDYDWPVHSADAIRRDGNELKFVSKRGVRVYDVSDPSRPAVFLREEKTGERPRKTTSTKPVKVGDIVFSYDSVRSSFKAERVLESGRELLSERFLLHSLSTLAVIGKTAYISAATPRTTGVWTLDLSKSGVVDFGRQAIFRKPPAKGTQNFTMLMQTVGDIAPLGGGYLLADDAVVRIGSDGTMEALGEREKPVCNWSKDCDLIALAQSDRLRVLDVSSPEAPRERARIVFESKYHVTGVALKGDNLWAIVNEKSERRMHSPNAFLGYVPPVSTCIRYRIGSEGLCAEASNTVPTSVSCEILAAAGGFRILYLAGTEGISLVDARTLSPIGRLSGLVSGAVYRIRRHGEFVYFTDSGEGVKELDVADPCRPVLRRVLRRSRGGNPPYDGFTIADGRLYALSHSSLDVYLLSGGDTKGPPPSPRFALNFGAVERGSAPLPGGYEAVAFGEGGLFIRKDGRYVSELPAAVGGRSPLVASSVESEGCRLTVIDRSAREKVIVDASDPLLPVIYSREKFDEK